jgi:hypothetical protein
MSDRFTPTPDGTFTSGPRTAGRRGDDPAADMAAARSVASGRLDRLATVRLPGVG